MYNPLGVLWSSSDHEPTPKERLHDAGRIIDKAAEDGVLVPKWVIEAIENCRGKLQEGQWHGGSDFLRAFSYLRARVEPVAHARKVFRMIVIGSLAVVLACQLYFTIGSGLHERIAENQAELDMLVAENGNDVIITRMREDQTAYYAFVSWLLPPALASGQAAVVALETVLEFMAAFLLPALYGLLGSSAFILRQLSGRMDEIETPYNIGEMYRLRITIGVLAGLTVGWFIRPDNAGMVASLSPLALAFVAGYGSDLLFTALDRIVQAFTSGPGDNTRLVHLATGTADETDGAREKQPDGADHRSAGRAGGEPAKVATQDAA